jgi:hypothetical protein
VLPWSGLVVYFCEQIFNCFLFFWYIPLCFFCFSYFLEEHFIIMCKFLRKLLIKNLSLPVYRGSSSFCITAFLLVSDKSSAWYSSRIYGSEGSVHKN